MASNMNKKVERIAEKRDNRPHATAKYIRISPYKVRTVLALIRGKSCGGGRSHTYLLQQGRFGRS